MSFINHLKRLGIYYDADGGGGGGASGRSLEEMTNSKISGTVEDPEKGGDEPEPAPTPKPKADDDDEPSPKPTPKPKASDDDDEPEPAPKKKEESASDDDKGGDDDEGFYYDPEKHVEGKAAHTNKFKTREQAEFAAVHKSSALKDTIEEMEEAGISRGAIPLPAAFNDDPSAVDNLTNLEIIAAMDDKELRNYLNDSDSFRQKLQNKFERKKQETELRQTKNRFEELQVETYDSLKTLMSDEEVKKNLNKFAELESGRDFTKSKIQDKVKAELKPERDALEAWIDKVDSGDVEMSFKEFDEEKTRRVKKLEDKEKEIRSKYEPIFGQLEELYELSQDVDQKKEMSPAEKKKRMWSAFDEFQSDRAGDLAILEDDPSARAELTAFKNWAIQNSADFNDLLQPGDFNKAVKAWDDFKEKVRSNRQRKELNGEEPKPKSTKDNDDDIPKPGDQEDIKGDRKKNVGDVRRRSMDKLVELTNATVGA